MINRSKAKFARSINYFENELGAKNLLLQEYRHDDKNSAGTSGHIERKDNNQATAPGLSTIELKVGNKTLPTLDMAHLNDAANEAISSLKKENKKLQDDIDNLTESEYEDFGKKVGVSLTSNMSPAEKKKTLLAATTSRMEENNKTINQLHVFAASTNLEAMKLNVNLLGEQARGMLSAEADVKISANNLQIAKEQAKSAITVATEQADAARDVATIQAGAEKYVADKQLQAAKLSNLTEDQKTLDANENKAVSILLKYAMKNPEYLINPQKLIDDLNAARENREGFTLDKIVGLFKIDHSDAMELEKALKKDGKLKKADGVIDYETIVALTSVITENKEPLKEVGIGLGGAMLIGKLIDGTSVYPGAIPSEFDKMIHRDTLVK